MSCGRKTCTCIAGMRQNQHAIIHSTEVSSLPCFMPFHQAVILMINHVNVSHLSMLWSINQLIFNDLTYSCIGQRTRRHSHTLLLISTLFGLHQITQVIQSWVDMLSKTLSRVKPWPLNCLLQSFLFHTVYWSNFILGMNASSLWSMHLFCSLPLSVHSDKIHNLTLVVFTDGLYVCRAFWLRICSSVYHHNG